MTDSKGTKTTITVGENGAEAGGTVEVPVAVPDDGAPVTVTIEASDKAGNSDTGNHNFPVDTDKNDPPTVNFTQPKQPIQGKAVAGAVITTVEVIDPEDDNPSFDFTPGSNDGGYYEIKAKNIVLTQTGADYVNGGNDLPQINITATDNTHQVPKTIPVPKTNDAPIFDNSSVITPNQGATTSDTVITTVKATDPEGKAVSYTLANDSKTNYTIDKNGNIKLTEEGIRAVNNGDNLPALTVIATDADGAKSEQLITVPATNDAPVITIAPAMTISLITTTETVIATATAIDSTEQHPTFTYSIKPNTEAASYYKIDQTTREITLTSDGLEKVKKEGTLPDIVVIAQDSGGAKAEGTHTPSIDITPPGDTSPGGEIEEAPSISIAEATDGYINYKELYGTDDNPAGIQTTVTLPTGTEEGDTLTLTFKQGNETITLVHTVTAAEAQSKSVALDILATGNNTNAATLDYTVVNAESYTLKDGDYTVTALVTDKAGNPGKDSSPVEFTVDTRPVGDNTNGNTPDGQADNAPTVEIAEAKDNGFINKSELNNGISVKVTFPTGDNIEPAKAGDTVTLTFKKEDQADIIHTYTITSADVTNGSAEITVPKSSTVAGHEYNFADGGYQLTAVITDKAGNEGKVSTPSQDEGTIFTIDTIADAPGLAWETSPRSVKDDGIFNTAETANKQVTVNVTAPGNAQAGETIAVIVNGKTVETLTVGTDITAGGTEEITITLNDTDTHVDIKAVFTDQADNTATSATLSADVDFVAPKVVINSITTSDTTPTITGTVDDKTATVKVTISGNGLPSEITGNATVKADGTWSYPVPDASALSNGTYTVTATATDTAGNIGNADQNGTLTINTNLAINATDDEVTAFFTPAKQVKTPALAHYESQETLELVEGQADIAKLPFTLNQNDTIWLTVKQDNLVKLTDAFEVIVQNAVNGQEYTVASSSQQGGLLAGALSLEALGAVGDGPDMAFSVKDLPEGSYTLSVRGDSSKLADILKTIDLSTLGSNTIEGLVKETVLDLLHDTLVGRNYNPRSVLEQLTVGQILKVAKDTNSLTGNTIEGLDTAVETLIKLLGPLTGDIYNKNIKEVINGEAGGLLGLILGNVLTLGGLIPLGQTPQQYTKNLLTYVLDTLVASPLDKVGEALYNNVVKPLVSDVLTDTVLSGTHLDNALDGVLGTVRTTLDTLGLGNILPTVDDVVDAVADQVLSNPATLFPGLVADVYTMDGMGTYHVEGNVTEDSASGTHADNLGNATVVSIAHTNGGVTETKQLDADNSQANASATIDGNFGKLTIREDGSFSYDVTDPSAITEAKTEVFTYTLDDSNNPETEASSATLTIHLNPGQENITITTNSGAFLQGGSGDDVLTGDSNSNTAIFYNLTNTDPTGGNGKDTWTNFTLGDASVENSGADKIDISNLLINYGVDGSTASLGDYLQVESANGDTTIKIDRDGSAGTYQSTELLVLKGVNTTLETLINNHQIII